MQVLLDEKHKRLARRYAKQLNKSESEVIRLALETYEPNKISDNEDMRLLAEALKEGTNRAEAAIDSASKEIDKTLDMFQQKNK
jgi:hypothetical protein